MKINDEASETDTPTTRRRAATRRLKETPLSEADWIEAATNVLDDEVMSLLV